MTILDIDSRILSILSFIPREEEYVFLGDFFWGPLTLSKKGMFTLACCVQILSRNVNTPFASLFWIQ